MTPLKELLPSALAEVAKQTGRARQLKPVWDQAVGEAIARCATPLALEGKTLVVGVVGAAWAKELTLRETELLKRLAQHLGKGAVTRLVFRVAA